MPRARRAAWAAALLASLLTVSAARADVLYYPRPETLDDERGDYPFQLLQMALIKAGSPHQLVMTPHHMQQNRSIVEIMAATGTLHIVATMTSREREEKLLPVRIPISKGLIGWRMLLVRADQVELFRGAKTLADLKPYKLAQGHDWPDLAILRGNGLAPTPVSTYDSLFGMLKAGRVDYVPRAVNEIWPEAARHKELAVEPHVVLHYPTADYYFLNRADGHLAEQIRRGLELAIADGTMDQLFYQHYGKALRRSRLDKRRVLELKNPGLPAATPLDRKELWFRLEDLRHIK
ncbi:substrate-binding periplasmic protein [Pseudoduganella namucuonensis]|nr:hypothetical protein [Pseudoduganella namucuonensis]